MTRFLHTSDWQLGMTRHYLSKRGDDDPQARFTADRIETVRRLGDVARQEDCEFVIVAGDVFETHNVSTQIIARACEAMASIKLPVYLLPGNHDSLEPGCLWDRPEFTQHCPGNVRVLKDQTEIQVTDGNSVVIATIVAAPLTTRHPSTDPLAELAKSLEPTQTPRILVGHGQLEGLSGDTRDALISRAPLEDAITRGALNYVALGDRHIAWPLNDDHAAIRYSGTQETTSFNEEGVGTAVIVDLSDPLTCQTVDVGTWLHARVSQEVANEADLNALRDTLNSFDHRDRTIIRYDLHGQVTISQKAELDEIIADFETVFASIEPSENRHDLTVIGDDVSLADADVPNWVRDAADELSGMCATSDDAVAALTLLHRLVSAEVGAEPAPQTTGVSR
ncbi:DNA repair exonuclease [Cutibacterium sp. WCA-380-WT-3A]|uniref:Nuclease SbcCD subunit D n=1 Tax=Cutibacterium porci TaxID=2605781 RepID=A0A7K0J3Y9_9ACTN|nr:metallophosphoesterase [Cutibacterium porci]MSS44558.1 DNA repair exonuclease [Cutibacterium porci]